MQQVSRLKVNILQTLALLALSLTTTNGSSHLLLLALLALRTNVLIINRSPLDSRVNFSPLMFLIIAMMSIKHFIVWQGVLAPVLYLDAMILCSCAYALLSQEKINYDVNREASVIAIGASVCLFLSHHFLLTTLTSKQMITSVNELLELTTSVLLVLIIYFDYLKLLMPQEQLSETTSYLTEQSKWLLVLYALFKVAAETFDIHSVYQQIFGFAAVLLLIFVIVSVLPLKARIGSKARYRQGLDLGMVQLNKILILALCLMPVLLDCCFNGQQGHVHHLAELFYYLCPLVLLSLSYVYALLAFCKSPAFANKNP